jgi:ParB family chromosome partitioning protein
MTARPIDKIRIGTRHRREMGDIASLAASIEDIGLLNPITIDEDGLLLAGARRLAACKLLGWTEVPVNIVRCAR